jgi:hypothetical protein
MRELALRTLRESVAMKTGFLRSGNCIESAVEQLMGQVARLVKWPAYIMQHQKFTQLMKLDTTPRIEALYSWKLD